MIRTLCLVLALSSPAMSQPVPEAIASYGDPQTDRRLLVRGTTDVAAFDSVLSGFVAATAGLAVDYEQWASNDLYDISAASCRAGTVGADLIISSAVNLQVRLVNDRCAQPHRSALTEALPDVTNWRNELFGITREPAVMVYNRALVPPSEAPRSRFDLIDLLRPAGSRYAGRVATYDIEASGLGYLFAFSDAQQATTFGSLVEAFDRAGAIATCCSAEIIDGVASGRYLIAYNVLGSYAAERAAQSPDLAIVAPSDYTLVLSRAAMIPRGATQPEAAGQLLDFLLSPAGRQALTNEYLLIDVPQDGSETDPTVMRPIALTPALLVGLDQMKRQQFLQLWRAVFSDPASAD